MGAFGGKTPKPIDVFSSSEHITDLKRREPTGLDRLAEHSNGQVNGKRKQLRQSQSYPCKFGAAVCALFKRLDSERVLLKHFGPFFGFEANGARIAA